MACFTTPGFYYGPCGIYTMGLTAECSTEHPPPLPHVCARSCAAVVTCGVMETVVSGAMCSGSTDMPLGVFVLIGKSRKMKGSWLLRSSPSVSPIAQRRDCLNLALCRPSWVTPRWPMRNQETGSCLVRRSSGRSFGFEKALLIKGGVCWCSLFNLLEHYTGLQKCALVYFIKPVLLVPEVVSPAGHPDASESLKTSCSC